MALRSLQNQSFLDAIEEKFGRYEKTTVMAAVDSYITKFIRPEKLEDVLCFIEWFYEGRDYPPNPAEIEQAINTAIKKRKGDDPFIHPEQPPKYKSLKEGKNNYDQLEVFFKDLNLRLKLSRKHNLKTLLKSQIDYKNISNKDFQIPNYENVDFSKLEKKIGKNKEL